MGTEYIVKSGDWLSKIAQDHGYETWQEIYYHEDNDAFRELRPNPDLIFPGDRLILPEREAPAPPPPVVPPTPEPVPEDFKTVIAKDGDTLCGIAVANGFRNCKKLRDANPAIANRQVKPGDEVKVPPVTPNTDSGETEKTHEFVRVGEPPKRLWFIKDNNQPDPKSAVADEQEKLKVSNFVPTRQGAGKTNGDWRDHTFFGHDADASADPDHFKIQVWDDHARKAGETELKITIQTQKPKLNTTAQIESWEDMTETGTKLVDVVCKQVAADSPWYRSHYLRLVIDTQDQTAKRPYGRTSPTADAGTDVSKQTLVVPSTTDKRIEILDLRVLGDKEARDCGATTAAAKCRARTIGNVGKSEKALKIKVVRVGGAAGSGVSNAQADTMIFTNYRLTLAQSDVGVKLVGNQVLDVPLPNNMIAVSDFDGVKASGGGSMNATVNLGATNVTGTITTSRKDTPVQTARKLANALRAKGITCTVLKNPPVISSSNNFGSCDILCFKADATPARIIAASSTDSTQKLAHTGTFNNASVRDPRDQYGIAKSTDAQIVGSMDYRAVCKNYNTGTDHLCVMLVNGFTRASLLGKALLPYRDVKARIRPVRSHSMCVFLDQGGAAARTVLTHEAGHVLLDAFHTTGSDANETDMDGATYDNNVNLSYSEWMSAFNREPNFIHKRMSDDPLTVKFAVVKKNVNNLQAVAETLGGAKPSPVKRFRSLSSFVLENLRTLEPAPGSNL